MKRRAAGHERQPLLDHRFCVFVVVPKQLCRVQPRQSLDSSRRLKNTYELLNPRALKISMLYKNRIFQCMDKIFCVEFQRFSLKFHAK